MAIDFSFPPEIDALRLKVRDFIAQVVRPAEARIAEREGDRRFLIQSIIEMRVAAHDWGLWLPHMPKEYGGMGLGPSTASPTDRCLPTPLPMMAQHARWARFADGADEVHQWRIAQRTIEAYKRDKSTRAATGNLPL